MAREGILGERWLGLGFMGSRGLLVSLQLTLVWYLGLCTCICDREPVYAAPFSVTTPAPWGRRLVSGGKIGIFWLFS